MSSNSDLDPVRQSISATLNEIISTEQHFRDLGVEIADEGEWLQLRDIIARIERRLLANMSAQAAE